MNNDFWPSGWHDNTQTNHREFYRDGVKDRHGHKSGIGPNSIHPEFRKPWGTYPNYPANQMRMQA